MVVRVPVPRSWVPILMTRRQPSGNTVRSQLRRGRVRPMCAWRGRVRCLTGPEVLSPRGCQFFFQPIRSFAIGELFCIVFPADRSVDVL